MANVKVPLGHLKSISMEMDSPKMKIENLDLNALSMLTGQNATGKSFVLTMSWYVSWVANAIIVRYNSENVRNLPGVEEMITEITEFGASKSFDVPLTGCIQVEYESGLYIKITFEEGKCKDVFFTGNIMNMSCQITTFLSANMRTFESIHMYCKFRKNIVSPETPAEIAIMQMCDYFKLYDVMYIEKLIERSPIYLDKQRTESLAGLIGEEKAAEIKFIAFDKEADKFWAGNGKTKKYLEQYSKGEQSMINMMIAQ